jgi:hypothetical protein
MQLSHTITASSETLIMALTIKEKKIVEGFLQPIRKFDRQMIAPVIAENIMICARLYCGMKDSEIMKETVIEAAKFTIQKFSHLGANEIKDAFQMAAANEFQDVNMTAYFGQMSIATLGDILDAYTKHRNKTIAKYLELKEDAQKQYEKEVQKEERNNAARQKIKLDIEAAIISIQQGIYFWQSWHDVPVHYAEIAVSEGWVEVSAEFKKRVWEESKELAKKELIETAQDHSNLLEARKAKQILMQNVESQIISEPARRIYAKRIIFEYIKQHEL